ncbi:hypothetical protein [Pseudomonas aeruginosa]|uniref:hypothetical protein n=1 Tax=Pseudomonas aeruginosa TaxID=287 RepID=UPI0034E22465
MNAINKTETQAVAMQEAAAPAQNLILVPLSQLRASKRNVRKTAGQSRLYAVSCGMRQSQRATAWVNG